MQTRSSRTASRRKPRSAEMTSRLMRAIRRKGTAAEVVLRAALRRRHIFCRAHERTLPGTPDLIIRDRRTAVFVDGDYWHGRIYVDEGLGALKRAFRSRTRHFWIAKIVRNVQRDKRQSAELIERGWRVVRLWERDILSDPESAASKVERVLVRKVRF